MKLSAWPDGPDFSLTPPSSMGPRRTRRAKPKHGTNAEPVGYFREWRIYRDLTQERAAERAEVSVSAISQLENGEQGISDRMLAALAHAYNCEIADLFRDPNRPDYQLWQIINGMKPDQQAQALRLIKALTSEAA